MSAPAQRVGALDLPAYAALALGAYALKAHYRDADADALGWILTPTARSLELVTGSPWVREHGLGYLSVQHGTALVAGCAGVNFLIVAAAVWVVGFSHRWRGPGTKLAWRLSAAPVAYAAAVLTNTLRVLADIGSRPLVTDPALHAHAHRLLGIGLYFGGACALCVVADHLSPGPRRVHLAVPAGCYLAISLWVPLLNGAATRPGFAWHAAAVLSTVLAIGASLRAWVGPRVDTY